LANISITGGTSPSVAVYGNNLGVSAGVGTDSVGNVNVSTTASVGSLNTLTINESLKALSALGVDTINLGSGADTIVQSGQATIANAFSIAGPTGVNTYSTASTTLANARTDVNGVLGGTKADVSAVSTVIGGALDEARVTGQNGITDVSGVFSGVKADAATVVGGTGVSTLTGGTGSTLFEFLGNDTGSQSTITNFVSTDKMYVEGYSLSYLQANHDISTQGGNTYISIDGGKTSIELKGFTGLNSSEITTHKT
jgi:hypothetical protein